jgi:hypothetical protein
MFSSPTIPSDHDKTAEDHRKRAREGHAPGSESDEDRPDAPPDLKELIDAAIAASTDKLVTALIPALMTTLSPEIKKYVEFELGIFKDAVKLEVTNITTAVKDIAGRLEAVERRPPASSAGGGDLQTIQDLQGRLARMEVQVERQDQTSRANHLIMHKVKEGVEGQDVRDFVSGLLPGVRAGGILEARRLGALRQASVRPRPILVTFADSASKHVGFRQAKTLRQQDIHLDDDITPVQQDTRFGLRERYLRLRAQGARPHWRGARLFYYHEGREMEDGKGPADGRVPRPPHPFRSPPAPGHRVPSPHPPPGHPPASAAPPSSSTSRAPAPAPAPAPPTSSV